MAGAGLIDRAAALAVEKYAVTVGKLLETLPHANLPAVLVLEFFHIQADQSGESGNVAGVANGWHERHVVGVVEGGREPVNREPEKCSELGWFPLDALPDDMVAYCRAGLEAYRAGHRFALHWHEPDDPIAYAPEGPDRLTPL